MKTQIDRNRRIPFRVDQRVCSRVLSVIGLFCLLSVGGCATTATQNPTPMADAELHRSGRVILSGQVSQSQLHDLQAQGVQAVVNCRTQGEMDGLSFDEPGVLDELSMGYTHLPLGGDDGYSPADVDAFAAALKDHDGDVLVHCSRGGRVRTLYTAYLVRYQGYSVDDARRHVQALGDQGPTSIERLLGERVRYELTGEPLPPEDTDSSS